MGLFLVVLTGQINLKHGHVSLLTRQNAKDNTSLTSLLKRNGVRIFCYGGGGGGRCGRSKWPAKRKLCPDEWSSWRNVVG